MADHYPPSASYEAPSRDERTVTSLVIDTDKRLVTVTLGTAIMGARRRTFVAAISDHPELLDVTLGDELCAPMAPEAADGHGPNHNSESDSSICPLPSSCSMGRCGLLRFPGSRSLAPASVD